MNTMLTRLEMMATTRFALNIASMPDPFPFVIDEISQTHLAGAGTGGGRHQWNVPQEELVSFFKARTRLSTFPVVPC